MNGTALYVDDDENDRLLMRRAFLEQGFGSVLHMVENGQAAIDYLAGVGPYGNRQEFPLPHTLIVDLNMPRIGGFEVLKWVKAQPTLKKLRVILFSGSYLECDKVLAQTLGAAGFVEKPRDPVVRAELVSMLVNWSAP